MPPIILAGLVLSLASWGVLAAAAYLLWSWYQGSWVMDAYDVSHHVREHWRLWTALALLAWSCLGRLVLTPLLTKADEDPTRAERGEHQMIASPTGSNLYVEVHGPADAPTVILTHGWGLDSTIWYYLRRHLSQRFRVIVWDLPGLGRSRAASGSTVDLSHFATDLKALLSLTNGKPAILVGHSIGGMTIQTLVRDHPEVLTDQVAGLVLVNTTYINPLKTMVLSPLALALRWPVLEPVFRLAIWLQPLAWLGAWQSYLSGSAHMANRIGFASQVTRSQLEQTTLLATRNPPAASARGNLAMFRWDAHDAIVKASVPCLILAGDKDIVTKQEASEHIAGQAPFASLRVIDDANHMGFLERSEAYNEEIARFCELNLVTRAGRGVQEPVPTLA